MWGKRDFELIGPVFGMDLLDADPGIGGGGKNITYEILMLERPGQAVLRPERRR